MSVVSVERVVSIDGSVEFFVEGESLACAFPHPFGEAWLAQTNESSTDFPFPDAVSAERFCLESIRLAEGGSSVRCVTQREDLDEDGLSVYKTEFENEGDN